MTGEATKDNQICPRTGQPCLHFKCTGPYETTETYTASGINPWQETIIKCGRAIVYKSYTQKLVENLIRYADD